jgi:hypothetical protein
VYHWFKRSPRESKPVIRDDDDGSLFKIFQSCGNEFMCNAQGAIPVPFEPKPVAGLITLKLI